MDLHIDIELQGALMLATLGGSVRFEAVLRLLKQMVDTAVEKRVNRILVDSLAMDGELATFERYDLGVEMAAYLAERQINVKLAFVGRLPTVNGFGARVARNRGVVVEVFLTHQEALTWLG